MQSFDDERVGHHELLGVSLLVVDEQVAGNVNPLPGKMMLQELDVPKHRLAVQVGLAHRPAVRLRVMNRRDVDDGSHLPFSLACPRAAFASHIKPRPDRQGNSAEAATRAQTLHDG